MSPSSNTLKCPHCQATVGRGARTCWLCGLELPIDLSPAAPHADVAAAGSVTSVLLRVAGGMIAVVLALIIIGLIANESYGGVIALVILLLPAGIVTLNKAARRTSEGTDLSFAETFGTFLLSLAVTVGAVVALGVAAFVAFFVVCLAIIASDGGMSFH